MKRLLALLLFAGLAAAGLFLWALNSPYAGFRGEVFVEFPRGTGTREMARQLAEAGVIRDEWRFLAARALRRGRTLQAGEYRFGKPASVMEVYGRIARGDVFYYELSVPEGKNIFEIGALAEELSLFTATEFLKVARDPSMIREIGRASCRVRV